MAVMIVSYDLRKPGRDYEPVYKALRGVPHCRPLESFWLIDVTQTPMQVRDALSAIVDENDKVFVARFNRPDWASFNSPCSEWLKSPDRNW